MNSILQHELDQLNPILDAVKHQALNYLNGIQQRPTSSFVHLKLEDALPELGIGTMKALEKSNFTNTWLEGKDSR